MKPTAHWSDNPLWTSLCIAAMAVALALLPLQR